MDSKRTAEISKLRRFPVSGAIPVSFPVGWLALLTALFFLLPAPPRVRADFPFLVTIPSRIAPDKAVKLRVRFETPPPSHAFYRLQVNVDGKPVAMADLSAERSTWITLEPQFPGHHRIEVIWRNPTGGAPLSRTVGILVAPEPSGPPKKQ